MRDDLAAYALGAFDERETAAVEEHLAACEGCAEYVRWLQPAVDLLPASVEQVEPPERLRASLMDAVRADTGPAPAAEREPRRWSFRGLSMRPATVLAACAVLVAGALAGLLVSDSGDDRAMLEAEASARRRTRPSPPPSSTAPAATRSCTSTGLPRWPRATSTRRGSSRGGTMEPAASFTPHEDGTAEVALGDSLEGADAVLVTEEPSRRPGAADLAADPARRSLMAPLESRPSRLRARCPTAIATPAATRTSPARCALGRSARTA